MNSPKMEKVVTQVGKGGKAKWGKREIRNRNGEERKTAQGCGGAKVQRNEGGR